MRKSYFVRMLAALLVITLSLISIAQPTIISAADALGNNAPGAPFGLLTNESEYPMNVEGAPMFDWWVSDEDFDEIQTAYQIRLYDGVTDSLVWDSGKVESANQNCVLYAGDPLKSSYPYSWEVRTWDKWGAVSPFSERAHFSTGVGNDNWDAYWIQGIFKDGESPLDVVETEKEDILLAGNGFALASEYAEWSDYELTAVMTLISGATGVAFRTSLDETSGYVWQLVPNVGIVRNKLTNGKLTRLGDPIALESPIVTGKEYTLTVRAEGDTITTTLDGTKVDEYTDTDPISKGSFGFYTEKAQKTRLHSLSANQTSSSLSYRFKVGVYRYLGSDGWTDYTVDFDMVLEAAAMGVYFRLSPDSLTGYMWQFHTTDGLKPHFQKNGTWTKQTAANVKRSFELGKKYHITIEISGNVFTTYVDGVEISRFTDTANTYESGMFGIRQGGNETSVMSNLVITSPEGTVLCRGEDFADNYSKTSSSIETVVTEAGSYTTEFSAEDLAGFTTKSDTLPIKNGTHTVYWVESKGDGVTILNYGLEWTDYTISLDVMAITTSAGVVFRAPDNANTGFMWAVRGDGKLRLHSGAGKYSKLADKSLKLAVNTTYHLSITVKGDTITTYLDGKLVDTRTNTTSLGGTIGFRTDSKECGRYTNVTVTSLDGEVLFADDFSDGPINWGTSGALNAENSYWYSRKEVDLDDGKDIKKALAFVSGSQDYELSVNGVRIGRAQTYDYPGETRYQGWDITDAVVGEDTMAIGVLTSYFGSAQGRAPSKPGLIGKFVVYYTDGTSDTVVTNGTWLTHDTGYSNAGKRNGEGDEIEYCDARLMLEGWSEAGYDTTGWLPVIVHAAHPTTTFTKLVPEIGHVAETTVTAVSVTTLEDGTTVADFGKIIPARVMIHFPSGTAGTTLTVQEGYVLNSDGSINTDSEKTQSTNMTYVYTMKDGEQTFEAWGYLGFRYVSVPAEAGTLTAEDFKATILHAEIVSGRESTLTTSDEMLNEVFLLMQRSALYSVQNQFVDTPTREKGQFLYDTINISAATMSGSYERQMTRKAIIQFLNSADRHWSAEDKLGMYTAVYPNEDGARDIPEFSLSVPIFVWRYYMMTGDRELLEYAYPYMKNTAGYVTRNINEETGLVTAIQGGGTSTSYKQGIVDTPADRFGYDWNGTLDGVRTTINGHCVRVYDIVATMSHELGYTEDEALYTESANKLREAMNKYLISESGVYCDGLTEAGVQSTHLSQHATSHAIMAGAPTEDMMKTMLDYIAGLGMRQGTTTADILLEALFENGYGDAAVRLLTNPSDYGWAKIVSRGGTFMWENWHGTGSLSHGWGSASLWQVIEYISGVKLVEAGAKTIRIDPSEGSIDEVSSHTVTARGEVNISYSGSGKDYVITIEVPANVTAEVVFPVIAGGKFVEVGGNNGTNEFTDESQIMTVGSGRRTFKYSEDGGEQGCEHSYEPVVTLPTCTERGFTTYTCGVCGDSYVADYVNAHGHTDNEYGYCSVCEIKITGAAVKLGSDLSIKYYVKVLDESILGTGSLLMEFSMNGESVSTVTEYGIEDGKYTFIFDGIAPQQMADKITATVKLDNGGTYTPLAKKADYSLKDNCINLLEKTAEELEVSEEKYCAMRTLIADTLAYGKAAQDYKNYTDNGYATDGVEGLVPSSATPIEADEMELSNTNESLYFKSASVRFDSVNKVYVKFFENVEDRSLVTVSINGTVYSLADIVSVGEGEYKITTEGISATDFDETITVLLMYNGETVASLTYSVNAYAYAMYNGYTENEEMQTLALALYRYGKSAEMYAAAE